MQGWVDRCCLTESAVVALPCVAPQFTRQVKDNATVCKQLLGSCRMEMRGSSTNVAYAKPQSRGVLMGKTFLEGLSSLPSLTAESKASARASGRRCPRSTYLPALMALSRCLGIGGRLGLL